MNIEERLIWIGVDMAKLMLRDRLKNILDEADKKKLFITTVILVSILYKFIFAGGLGIFDKKYQVEESSGENVVSDFVDRGDKGEDKDGKKAFSLEDTDGKEEIKKISVYITGAVSNPGVISIDSDKRLDDAIRMAGGLLEKADINRVNLAMKLEDSQHYIIPYVGQDIQPVLEGLVSDGRADGEGSSANVENSKININSDDQKKLEDIPGVGPATAKKIIDHRKNAGPFKKIEDIKNVSGIGDKKFENMKDFIDVK